MFYIGNFLTFIFYISCPQKVVTVSHSSSKSHWFQEAQLIQYNFQKHHCFHTCFFPTHVRIHNCFVLDFSLQFPSSPLVLPFLFSPNFTKHNWFCPCFFFPIPQTTIGWTICFILPLPVMQLVGQLVFFFPFHKAQFLEQLIFIQPKFVNCLSPMLARWHLPRQSKKSAFCLS